MKTFFTIALLFSLAVVQIKIEAATYSGAEKNKVDLNVKNNLLRITRNLHGTSEVKVPQVPGYELKQVAVIEEPRNSENRIFDYLAVYRKNASEELVVILYNAKNKEELVIDSVTVVRFEEEKENSRISLVRTGPDGECTPSAILVPGRILVAHKG